GSPQRGPEGGTRRLLPQSTSVTAMPKASLKSEAEGEPDKHLHNATKKAPLSPAGLSCGR
ncbi:MAG: hypothetical protein ABWZ85_08025, partial [Luteibacter sp.]